MREAKGSIISTFSQRATALPRRGVSPSQKPGIDLACDIGRSFGACRELWGLKRCGHGSDDDREVGGSQGWCRGGDGEACTRSGCGSGAWAWACACACACATAFQRMRWSGRPPWRSMVRDQGEQSVLLSSTFGWVEQIPLAHLLHGGYIRHELIHLWIARRP